MKINEKHLVAYGTSPEGIVKEGFLNKRGEVNKVFQRRWFVLKGNLLFYGEKRGEKPNGVIVLEDCTVEVSDTDRYSFTISFFGGKTRVYILSADSEDEMVCWIKRISSAPFGYTAMVVKELEKRLDKLKKNETELLAKQREDSARLAVANDTMRNSHDEDLIDSSDSLLERINDSSLEPGRDKIINDNKHKATKVNANRNTIPAFPRSFNNLLTIGKEVPSTNTILPNVVRSKSSENLHKLKSKSPITSPVPLRRKFPQSVRWKKQSIDSPSQTAPTSRMIDSPLQIVPTSVTKESLSKAPTKSFFYSLHNQYAASIWTVIKDYETGSCEDLISFD